ncbi:MAG: DNA-3-methyladenine glycosylase I [Gemmatimonadaceae bacterium]
MSASDGLRHSADGVARCWWCGDSEEYVRYHDLEWGAPVTDDVRLFEKLSLEGFQAGLSWITILRKRENFRRAFDGFVPARVAAYRAADVRRLLADPGIVRHRGKIEAAINNAARYAELRAEAGSLAAFIWSFEPEEPARSVRVTRGAIPATVESSVALSKALKKRGWEFVGPTTMYALFQAMGMVNDHVHGCARRAEIDRLRRALERPTA